MKDCIFCKIVNKEFDSVKVYEDDDVFAFLDIIPNTTGHTLIIPKTHFENIFDIDEVVLQKIMAVGKKLATNMKTSLRALGVNIASNNGKHTGQVVPHFHLHIIPRYENDGLQMYGPRKDSKPSLIELKEIAKKIKL